MTTPNAELAYKALDTARANNALNMAEWVNGGNVLIDLAGLTAAETCGTTACLAGWAVALAGFQVTTSGRVYDDFVDVGHIQPFAAELLGITVEESEDLFFVADEDVDAKVAEIFGPRPAVTA